MIFHLIQKALHFLIPHVCIFCGTQAFHELSLCEYCQKSLPQLQNPCQICAMPLTIAEQICGSCLKHPPDYHHTIALFAYQKPIDFLIGQLKFKHELLHARILGILLAEKIALALQQGFPKPEVIVPIPLHHERLRERGFNQALEIARPVSQRLKIPIENDAIVRIKPTLKQSNLSFSDRHSNLKNAFEIKKPLAVGHIAVIDDVITTGETIKSCSKIFRREGKMISIFAIARTILGRET